MRGEQAARPSFQSRYLDLFHKVTMSSITTMLKQLGLVLRIAILIRSMPLSFDLGERLLLSRNLYLSPANPTCHPNDIAIDTTSFENYAKGFCADITTAPHTSQNISATLNQTLTMAVKVISDSVKCQVTPDDCISAMQLIHKTCEYPFP
jgi:hypothetical protein